MKVNIISSADTSAVMEKVENEDFAERFRRIVDSCSSSKCLIIDESLKDISEYTYATVHDMVCQLQRGLQVMLIEPKQLIAIQMERSANLLITLLTCLVHRSPFLLIEPNIPVARRNFLLADAKPILLITDQVGSTVDGDASVPLTTFSFREIFDQGYQSDTLDPFQTHSCDDTMYIMYTSGSTGQPKGVIVPYRAMYNRFNWMWKTYPWREDDVQLWKTSITFGDCIWEMLGGLLAGVPTVVASASTVRDPYLMLQLIRQTTVTRITLIPTMLSNLLKLLPTMPVGSFDSLRYVIVSGEALPKAVCKQFLALSSNALLLNLYGSTEIGNDATYYEVRHLSDAYDMIPIGKPITNIYYKIVDDELWIAGDGLCKGYLNNSDMTMTKFVHDIDGRRYFKTGDCVRECVRTGQLLFLGRIDNGQVKLRGVRIELEEVEAICMQHPLVQECGCFVHEAKAQLIAVVQTSSSDLSNSILRQWIANSLPEFEVPSVFIFTSAPLPRTVSGKIDRKKLVLLHNNWKENNPSVTITEIADDPNAQRIIDLWCSTLEIEKEDERSNRLTFTELGGHSLLAMQLQCIFRSEFDIQVPVEQFFHQTTVGTLITFIQNSKPIRQPFQPSKMKTEKAPLTLAQKSIWIADELQNSSTIPTYNVAYAVEILPKDITNDRIKEAVYILLERHDSLHMIFSRDTSGEIHQTVTRVNADLTMTDLRIFEEIAIENIDETDQVLTQLARRKFHLNEPQPLCRFFLCLNKSQRILVVVLHHLIVDGWSIGILLRDLNAILTSQALPSVAMQFPEYAQLEYNLDPHVHDAALNYWQNKLNNGALTPIRLLHDHEATQGNEVSFERVQIVFPSDITNLIHALCKDKDVTPFMVLLSTFKSLLARYTQETDIIVGVPVANRTRSEVENTVGLFTNTLVLRTSLPDKSNLVDLLSEVKKTVIEAFTHQSLPFVSLLNALEHLQRGQHRDPLFQIMFAYQNVGNESTGVLRKVTIHEQAARFELEFHIWPESTSILIEGYFRSDLFCSGSIERLLHYWLQITYSALSNPMEPYTRWSMVSNNALLSISSVVQPMKFYDKNLCQLFLEQVQRTPHAIAIEDGSVQLTYTQVWRNSSHFSQIIRQVLKLSSKQCIAIRMRRGAGLIQTILSVLISGNYYVYIDSALPVERQHFILKDTHASLMITDVLEYPECIPSIRYEDSQASSTTATVEVISEPTELAYILYTSGSTGTPKGVCASQRAIVARMVDVNYHSIGSQTRTGQLSTFSFDMSTFEMFGTLLNGGTLVIVPPELTCSARALLELKLDIISPSTAVLNILAQQEPSRSLFTSLRKIYFGGEKVNMKHLRRVVEHQVLSKFVHVYGPTETTVFALFYELCDPIPVEALTVPIGQPLTNTLIYIVDKSFQLTPRGVPGQLLIGGAGLSQGYHNRNDLTQQKFIPNPFAEGVVYCSGDICRMLDNGNIEFLGRVDNQVKLRSQRLELGEIEFHLLQHELIADAVVILREDIVEGEKHLVSYVQPLSPSNRLDPDQLRTFLVQRLPDYMVPAYFIVLSQFPLNNVGKIDKKSLPKPSRATSSLKISDVIRQICAQVLKQNDIDMNMTFFRAGGHSLSAMEIIAKVYESLNVQITIPIIFQAKSMFDLAQYIEAQVLQNRDKQVSTVKEDSSPLTGLRRIPLTPAQQQFWLFWKLKPNSAYYNVPIALEINGELNVAALTRSFQYLMSKYTLLRTRFHEGSDGTFWQEEKNDWNLPLIEESLEGTFRTSEVRKRLQYYSMQPFDLTKGHVCRFVILHLSKNQHVLLICFHHIVCDGQSASQFVSELFDLYALGNSTSSLNPYKENSFFDYAIRLSRTPSSSRQLEEMIDYLRDFQSLDLETNTDTEQNQDVDFISHVSSFVISSHVAEKLRELAMSHACTLHTVLLALFKCFLSVYSFNACDIVLGCIVSLRSQPGVSDIFGPLINTVPIRTLLPDNGNTTFIDLLESVRTSVLFAMEHQMIPFSDIVQRLRMLSTDPSLLTYLPIVRVLFEMNSYNLFNRTKNFLDGTEWTGVNNTALLLPYTKSDIDLEIMDYGSGQPVSVTFNLSCNVFKSEMAKNMADCYRCAIETVSQHPTCLRTHLWQQLQLIRENKSDMIIHECVRRQAEIRPKHPAIVYQNEVWTYDELVERAERIASHLCDKYTRKGIVIGLHMKRCPDLIAAMLGALMAGATYLYLDSDLPDQRMRAILQEMDVQVVIESEEETSSKHSTFNGISRLPINTLIKEPKHNAVFPIVKSSDYCYLIYTSGSTGEPKGIKIQHQAVVRRIHMPTEIMFSSRVAQLCSCSFDVYILEVYGALLNGATLVIYDKALIFQPKLLSRQITQQHITHMYLSTPIFNLLAEHAPDVYSNMECVLFAGDRANAKLICTVLQISEPPKRLINAYGPTEATCIVTWYDISMNSNALSNDSQVPIGFALPDTPLYIVNPTTLELVPDGEEGELLIGGYGVSDGYVNNVDETAVRFLPNRYGSDGKVYRTGDRVKRCSDGNLLFLGRFDTQVKINGYRIELSEIEYVLQGYSTITEAVVAVRDDLVPNTQSIVAYVRPKKQIETDLRKYLSTRLPSYMLPAFIVPLDQFPISSTGGKRDMKSLPLPSNDHLSMVESKVQTAWNDVLNSSARKRMYRADDDFFTCGGTSINIVRLHAQLELEFGLTLDVMRLFELRTISSQTTWLNSLIGNVEVTRTFLKPNVPTKGMAIIGMSARYTSVETLDDLWTILRDGVDCCTHLTHEELLQQDPSMASTLATNPNYVHAGSTMTDAQCFDHVFFGMTKRDAEITDPQHRIMLEATYEALENAGLVPQNYTGTIGMFGAVYRNTYAEYHNLFRANPYEIYDTTKASMGISMFDTATIMRVEIGNMIDGAPTFISYKLGLTGPSMAIQTACSSSGTALHIALRSLEAGDCTVAIVAGVCISFPLGTGYNYQPGMIMSKTGVCRSFDESADGVVGGDGAGVVVLMKTAEAVASGYPIRAIITGYAINNDGQNKASFSTTSPDMQANCMKKALAMAQIQDPKEEIDYVEAHGPGTQMGDLLEIQALTKGYTGNDEPAKRQIYLGSIKTNVGHTAHAATIAGLIKVALSLEASQIPLTLNFHRFSPTVSRLKPPFQVNTRTISWPSTNATSRPRRAALNALGQGGTNTHFIIEQGYSSPASTLSSKDQLFLLSAKTDSALSKVKARLLDHLSKIDDHQLANVAFTLACGRIAYDKRWFAVASSTEELKQQLLSTAGQTKNDEQKKARIVFVFPGQGSQYAGMTRQLYDRFPHTCASTIDSCLQELHEQDFNMQQTIRACLFDETFDDHVALAQYAQITLFIVEYSLASFLLSLNIRPDYLVGHSSGEFVAACIAGVMTVKDALRFLVKRCQLMMTAPSGAMLAVEMNSKDDALTLSKTYDVDLAAINSPTQYVYSSTIASIQKLENDMRNKGKKVKLLSTFTGFHSRLMDPICRELKNSLKNISLHEPTIPIISTVTGRIAQAGEMTQAKYWCDHLRQPVLFGPCLNHILTNNLITNDKSTLFIPVGPGKILCSFLSSMVPRATVINSPLSANRSSALLHTLGTIWMKTIPINWSEFFHGTNNRRVPLPTYPFERIVCTADNRAAPIAKNVVDNSNNTPKSQFSLDTTTSSAANNLFELLEKRQGNCKSIELKNNERKTPPWKITKQALTSVKLFSFETGTCVSIREAPTISHEMEMNLGSYSSLFVWTLYYEALEMNLIRSNDLIAQYLPSEYHLTNVTLTVEDLIQGKINTDRMCTTTDDLLIALKQITLKSKDEIDHMPNVFGLSLFGHILAALYETSYDEVVHQHIVLPLGLKQTSVSASLSSEAYRPAMGMRSSIADLQTMMSSSNKIPIVRALRKTLLNHYSSFTNAERFIVAMHPNDPDKVLIIASEQPIQQAVFESILEQTCRSTREQLHQPSMDYDEIVQKHLIQLIGSSGQIMASDFSPLTHFEQLGVDSLQAITFVELLSQKLQIELPVDIISNYPNIKSLSDRLAQLCTNNHHPQESFREYILIKEAGMPRVYEPTTKNCSLATLLSFITNHKMNLLKELHQCGALLFRGFAVDTDEDFSQVVQLLADKNKTFLDYRDGISPRTRLTDKVFTSTEYPKQFDMALHNEMSYSDTMPSMIFFFCQVPPNEGAGGETPIGNSAAIFNAIDSNIRQEFIDKNLLYITNLPSKTSGISLGKSWQDTYQTESKEVVEAFLRDKNIQFKWLSNDRLRTLRRCQAVRQHLHTGETVWCNHAHLFHPTDLNDSTREALQKRLEPLDMPKNCFFGNGDTIPDASLKHIRQVLKQHEIKWSWRKGDILVLDNMRTAHGRASFDGQRRILVAMC